MAYGHQSPCPFLSLLILSSSPSSPLSNFKYIYIYFDRPICQAVLTFHSHDTLLADCT